MTNDAEQDSPVAWMVYTQEGKYAFVTDNPAVIHPSQRALPLYATTPQRKWVGLTDQERDGKRVMENGLLFNTAEVQVWELAVQWAEDKLRERNS